MKSGFCFILLIALFSTSCYAEDINITVTYNNVPYDESLETSWGISLFIEGLEKNILFWSNHKPLGSIAIGYIFEKYNLPKKKVSEIHGQLFHTTIGDLFDIIRKIKIIPMFHPSAGLRTPELLNSIKKDWQKLNKEL